MIPKLTDEMFLAIDLRAKQVHADAFTGLTTVEQRKAKFRNAITSAGLAAEFGERFAKLYGEALS
jgi:hypothetical protein